MFKFAWPKKGFKNGDITMQIQQKQTTTQLKANNMDESLVLSELSNQKGYRYNRSQSLECIELENNLCNRYENGVNRKLNCVVTSSGMASISSLVQTIVSKHPDQLNIVYSSELYCDTPRLFKHFSGSIKNCKLLEFNATNSARVKELFQTKVKQQNTIMFVESCSNPHGYIFDFSMIPQLRSLSKNLYVIVDNTWLTEVIFNPLLFDVDFVVTSLTKYYSGGTAIGGAIVSDNELLGEVRNWMRVMGHHVSPHNCKLVVQNMATIETRIQDCSKLAIQVAEFLESKKVNRVFHPLCNSHPSQHLAKKHFKHGPGVFVFRVKVSKSKLMSCLSRMKILEFKTSFGAKLSRIDPWPQTNGEFMDCRLALGYEDNYDRVVKGLNELLAMIQ